MLTKFVVMFLITVVLHLSESVKIQSSEQNGHLKRFSISISLCNQHCVVNFHVGCELILATIDLLTFLALKCVLLQSIAI